jgi:hypothetical protein
MNSMLRNTLYSAFSFLFLVAIFALFILTHPAVQGLADEIIPVR